MAFAQEFPAIKVIGRATESTIKLRWAPTDPMAWKYANQYGFTVERYTILENGDVLDEKPMKLLTSDPLKPQVLEAWKPYMENDFVAITAQAIYGKSFEPSEVTSDLMQIINTARELENRFSFAVYACDHSIEAAKLAGLFLEDENVHTGYKYLYRVYANVPKNLYPMDTAEVFIGIDDHFALPPPRDLKVVFEDKMAMISWNAGIHSRHYNSFWVERSTDKGKTFRRITETPFIAIERGTDQLNQRAYKVDSLEANNEEIAYRVIGISPFGELSIPSDTVIGMGLPAFQYVPAITGYKITKEGVNLTWKFPKEGTELLRSFDLLNQNPKSKKYTELQLSINPEKRRITDRNPASSNYYIIRANDTYGRQVLSFPYFVQTEDSIPPNIPVGLRGEIDTAGHVFLEWIPNPDLDLHGYKVFKSNFKDAEYIQIPGPILTTNKYVDTIDVENLTEKIYYKVQALDNRFNPSPFSSSLEIKKPDLISPASPVFIDISSDSTGISLKWQPSSSDDVDQHLLYRRGDSEQEWTLIRVIPRENSDQFFHDRNLLNRTTYSYTLLAVDDDGLESDPAVPISIHWNDFDAVSKVENLNYLIQRDKAQLILNWNYNAKEVHQFLIFRGGRDVGLQLYKSVSGEKRELTDPINLDDEVITYRVMAVSRSGEKSKMSEELVVNIK